MQGSQTTRLLILSQEVDTLPLLDSAALRYLTQKTWSSLGILHYKS
jgi:hypothetical protein